MRPLLLSVLKLEGLKASAIVGMFSGPLVEVDFSSCILVSPCMVLLLERWFFYLLLIGVPH
jgi:hypothetical protein